MEASFVVTVYALIQNMIGLAQETNFFKSQILLDIIFFFNIDVFTFKILLIAIIIIVVTVLKFLNIFLNTFLYYKINSLISFKIFENTIQQEFNFYNEKNSSIFLSAIVQKSRSFGEITFFMLGIIKSIFMLISITVIAVYISSKTFLIFFFIFLFFFIVIYLSFKSKLKKIGIQVSIFNDNVVKILQETYASIVNILLYNCQKLVGNNFYNSIEKLRKNEAKIVFFSTVPYIFIQTISVLVILFFLYFFELKNNFTSFIPLVAMWLLAIQRLIPSFNEIFSSLSTIKGLNKNFLDVEYFLNLKIKNKKINSNKNKIIFKKN